MSPMPLCPAPDCFTIRASLDDGRHAVIEISPNAFMHYATTQDLGPPAYDDRVLLQPITAVQNPRYTTELLYDDSFDFIPAFEAYTSYAVSCLCKS